MWIAAGHLSTPRRGSIVESGSRAQRLAGRGVSPQNHTLTASTCLGRRLEITMDQGERIDMEPGDPVYKEPIALHSMYNHLPAAE